MREIVITRCGNHYYGKTSFDEYKSPLFFGLFDTLLLWSCPNCKTRLYDLGEKSCRRCNQKLKWGK